MKLLCAVAALMLAGSAAAAETTETTEATLTKQAHMLLDSPPRNQIEMVKGVPERAGEITIVAASERKPLGVLDVTFKDEKLNFSVTEPRSSAASGVDGLGKRS
ncbi:MAG: hypothetical protein AB7P23_08260 [Amphiplicatus sp.]